MTRGTSTTDMPDAYADLLVRFAPSSITSEDEAGMVQRQIDELIDWGALSPDERKLLSLLGDLMLPWEGDRYDLPAVFSRRRDTRVVGRAGDASGRPRGGRVPHQRHRLRGVERQAATDVRARCPARQGLPCLPRCFLWSRTS